MTTLWIFVELLVAFFSGNWLVFEQILHLILFVWVEKEEYAFRISAEDGNLAVIDHLLNEGRVDPSLDKNYALMVSAKKGNLATVERLLKDGRVNPSAYRNAVLNVAAFHGHLDVVDALLNDERVKSSFRYPGNALWGNAYKHLHVVERLLQEDFIDPSAKQNIAFQWVASRGCYGSLKVVDRLLRDPRVNPADIQNYAILWAARNDRIFVVDRLLEDQRVDFTVAFNATPAENRKRFEYRKRFTEICIALQDLQLPAWVTMKILKAARPWSTLPLHSKWKLVCTVKHFQSKK